MDQRNKKTLEAANSLKPTTEEETLMEQELTTDQERDILKSSDDETSAALNEPRVRDKKERLSGAARKRLKYLLKKGMPAEEAMRQARTPIRPMVPKDKGTKRTRSDGSTPKGNEPKKLKQREDAPAPKRVQGPSFSRVTAGIRVGILPSKYPEELLTTEQIKAVQERILDKIVGGRDSATIKPHFVQINRRPGWLGLVCGDAATFEWLKSIQAELVPWEGASLKVVSEAEMPHTEILLGYLPDSQEDSNERILSLIEAQNAGLKSSRWRIIRRNPVGPTLETTMSVDQQSIDTLKARSFQVKYKFGEVTLRPKSKPSKAPQGASTSGTNRPRESASRPNLQGTETPKESPPVTMGEDDATKGKGKSLGVQDPIEKGPKKDASK